jgi:hypothetical protein
MENLEDNIDSLATKETSATAPKSPTTKTPTESIPNSPSSDQEMTATIQEFERKQWEIRQQQQKSTWGFCCSGRN